MLAILAQHQLLLRIVGVSAALAFVVVALTALANGTRDNEPPEGRHGRGTRRGTRREIRRHRAGGRDLTWPGTVSVRTCRRAAPHSLDESDVTAVHAWSLRFEHTVDISSDLEAILGARPIGASA